MKYGYFDDKNKEYIITNPATPAPWVNYLGDPNYGAIISNNAGGYSFEKSGANGRLLRYVFNSFDEPGRYIYVRDNKTKDYFSTTWGPVHKDLKKYKNECHHGTAYSTFITKYSGIKTETTYYVPLNCQYEVWYLKVTNNSKNNKKTIYILFHTVPSLVSFISYPASKSSALIASANAKSLIAQSSTTLIFISPFYYSSLIYLYPASYL